MITYFAIRLDAPLEAESEPHWPYLNLWYIQEALNGNILYQTYGREISKKSKKLHIHCHFALEHNLPFPKGISSYLKRTCPDETFRKNAYAIQRYDTEPDRAWYGYVLKDYETFDDVPQESVHVADSNDESFVPQVGFSSEELREMWAAAAALREAAVKKFEQYENKMNNDMEVRAKTWAWLDEHLPNLDVRKNLGVVTREQDPTYDVAVKLVEYNRVYNNFKIPMDLKRRICAYLSHRGMPDAAIANYILK